MTITTVLVVTSSIRSPDRFPGLLAATTMGVYLLLVVGVATALTDAAAACTAWPACGNGWSLPATTNGWIAFGHRIAAVVVGIGVLITTLLAWRTRANSGGRRGRRVRYALTLALVLFPAQAGVGAVVAVTGGSQTTSMIHLAAGVVIFAALIAALAWWLEAETGNPDDVPDGPPEPSEPLDPTERPAIPTDPTVRT